MPQLIVPAPSAGIDWSSPAGYGPRAACLDAFNVLSGDPGKVRLRGPINPVVTLPGTPNTRTMWVNDSMSLVLLMTGTTLRSYNVDRNYINLQTSWAWPTGTAGAALSDLGNMFAQNMGNTFAMPSTSSRGMMVWDGTSGAGAITELATTIAPHYGVAIESHLNRLFVIAYYYADGTSDGDAAYTLQWTDPGFDGSQGLNGWKDDASGLLNKLVLGNMQLGAVIGMKSWGGRLHILRQAGIQALVGGSPSTWELRTVSGFGCRDVDTIVVTDEGIYFQSDAGFMLYDGVSTRSVSQALEPLGYTIFTGGMGVLPNNYLIGLAAVSAAGSTSGYYATMLYNRATGTWTRMDTNPYTALVDKWYRVRGFTVATDGTRIMGYDYVANPWRGMAEGAKLGLDGNSQQYNGYALSKGISPAGVGRDWVLRRAIGSGLMQTDNALSPTWSLSLYDNNRASIASVASAGKSGASSPQYLGQGPTLLRADVNRELNDYVHVRWDINPNTAYMLRAEVYDVALEYEIAQRRSA